MTHPKLWFKCLVENLETNTLLPEQIALVMSLHPGEQKKQYDSLKLLLFKTYTSVDAPELARKSFLDVRMNATLGPRSLLTLMLATGTGTAYSSAVQQYRPTADPRPT